MPWLTIQKTPTIAPHRMTKNAVNPYVIAGSQKAKQERPHNNVRTPAVSMRLKRSLKMPMIGRPIAVPTFRSPIMSVACDLDKPIDRAKSDTENSKTTYPNMLINA